MEQQINEKTYLNLSTQQMDKIKAIIENRIRISLDQEAIKEDISSVALELNMKSSKLNRLIHIIMKEQAKGGIINEETQLLDMAEAILNQGKTN
ncbi:MAG: hypothetical protein KGQ58_03690 [Proteobacteria bacterium]|nr:hypothetical protein [Pseudomonadota bacterium]